MVYICFMETKADIEFTIESINQMYAEYIEYIDSIEFTDTNEKEYVTSDTILSNTKDSSDSSVQYLQELIKDSLTEFTYIPDQDTTLFNICFEVYGQVSDDNFDKIIIANDLATYDRTDIDPNDPIIKKGTKILYYK